MHHKTDREWLIGECTKADSFAELTPLAIAELHKFSDGAEVICGPISTGGRGNAEANFAIFSGAINALQQQGRPIFSQIPYEERIFFFRKRWQDSDPSHAGQYYRPILLEFYGPLIRSGRIRKGWFIPGWERSVGAQWERRELIEMKAEICYLTDEWVADNIPPVT